MRIPEIRVSAPLRLEIAKFSRDLKSLFVVVYGLFEIAHQVVDVAKVTAGAAFSCAVVEVVAGEGEVLAAISWLLGCCHGYEGSNLYL